MQNSKPRQSIQTICYTINRIAIKRFYILVCFCIKKQSTTDPGFEGCTRAFEN